MEIAQVIKKIRQESGLSQQQFAKELNADQAMISRYERGRQKPSGEMIENIMQVAKRNNVKINLEELGFDSPLDIRASKESIIKQLLRIRRELDEIIDKMRFEGH